MRRAAGSDNMKLFQQLFGGIGLSLFGKSRSKVTVANANNSNGSVGGQTANKTTNVAGVTCRSTACRQSVVAADVVDNDSDQPEVTTPSLPGSPVRCWSSTANRICWGSPSARRSATRRSTNLGQDSQTEDARLPRSRSLIRTNPWLPPSSPPSDRHHLGLRRSPSPSSGSGSASCPPTPVDSPAESGRRWRLVDAGNGEGSGGGEGTTPVASEGYCSISSLCTMSDSAVLSTTACSDDMQMSVDSLASLFPTLMSSSSSSFHDDKTSGSAACGDSVVDSGIVDVDSVSTAYDGEVQRNGDFDVMSTGPTKSARSSDCGTPTNQYKTTSSASAATLTDHLRAVQAALHLPNADDYDFDADVFPFGSEVRSRPAAASQITHHQKGPDLSHTPLQPVMSPSRDVEEISSSLAASVERLRRGRVAVDGAFGRALAEDRRRQRELARLRRRMVEAQRDVLLGTLRDLRRELDDQCRRLQAAYDAVLTARWPRLHADTEYGTSTSANLCQSAV